MKKTLFKALSVVLAVIMIVGVLPFAFRLDRSLSASEETPTVETLETGVIQGPNDAVIIHTAALTFSTFGTIFKDNFCKTANTTVEGLYDAATGTYSKEKPFDRIIIVFAQTRSMGGTTQNIDMSSDWSGTENIVWTQKCTITNPNQVWTLGSSAASLTRSTEYTGLKDYFTGATYYLPFHQQSGSVAQLNTRRTKIGCNMTWDFINIFTGSGTVAKFPGIDCNGFSFKIGENVNFSYGEEDTSRFVLYNSTFRSGTQNIEILSGEWIGLLAFPAEQDCNQTLVGTINVTLGPKVTVIGANTTFGGMIRNLSVFANANMAETAVINYTINGTKFSGFVNSFVLGGHRCSSSDIHDTGATTTVAGTINININGYDEENPFPLNLAAQGLPSSYHNDIKVNTECGTGLTINARLCDGFAIAEGKKITIHSGISRTGETAFVTSTVYTNGNFGDTVSANYIHSLAAETCTHSFTVTAAYEEVEVDDGNGGVTTENKYKISLSCDKCGLARSFDVDRNGHPVIYVDALTGSDEYFGNTPANAVQSMDRASALLAKWNVGGTIVVVDGHNNREYASGFEPINTAGGTITITSSTNDFITARIRGDFRETSGACWVPYINIWTYEDVVLENLDIVSNMNTKAFYLNGNNLAIKESCNFRDYTAAALAGVGKRMELAEGVSSSATLAIVTGYNPASIEGQTEAFDIGTQNIVLEKGNFGAIVFGNSMANLAYEETLKPLSGNVNVYIGEEAIVTNIDALPEVSTLDPTFIFDNRDDYSITTADTSIVGVNIKATESVVNAPADHVVLANNDKLTFVQNSVKWEDGKASVRVENVVNAAWMDENVAELGFFIKEYDNAPFATYFAHAELTEYVNEGVGKSLAYENTENGAKNYFWDGESENVTFRGVLTYDDLDGETILNADKEFVAVPYALLTEGEYFVNGTPEVFTLREVCEAILASENASEEDKAKAQSIVDAIPAEKTFPEIYIPGEGGGDTPVVPEPDTDPVTDPVTEPATEPATEPTTEPVTEPVTDPTDDPTEPVDYIAFFDPSAITEDISGVTTDSVAISGSTGIASIQAGGSSNAKDTNYVSIENESGEKFIRFGNTGSYTYAQLVLFLESGACTETGEYTYELTYRLSEGFTGTDTNTKKRAVILRALNGSSPMGDVNVVTQADLQTDTDYTDWTTVTLTKSLDTAAPTAFSIIIFANPNDYIEIKSLKIYAETPDIELPELVVPDADAIKVACMGDSLTAGAGVDADLRDYYSYPAQLQTLLGSGYNVLNCGRSGATVLTNDSDYKNPANNAYHYGSVQKYEDAQAFAPDIAIIMLGTNDGPVYIDKVGDDAVMQAEFKAEFITELTGYGKTMESINPDVKIYLMLSPPYETNVVRSQNLVDNIHPIVREVAEANGWEVIDIYSAIEPHIAEGIYADGLHFTKDGYAIVAETVYDAITAVGEPMPEPTVASVVYVSNSGTGDGLTADTPTDLASALGMTKTSGGKIVLVDAVKLPYNKSESGSETAIDNNYYFPSTKNTVTITTVHESVDYGATNSASLTLNGNTYFYGDYEFNNIKLVSGISDIKIFCQYNNITFGEGVTTDKGSYDLPSIYAGYLADSGLQWGVYELSCHADGQLLVKSGTWNTIVGGNWRRYTSSPMGTVDSGVKYNIILSDSVRVNSGICAYGENNIEEGAQIYFEINGGVISGTSYLGSGYGTGLSDGLTQSEDVYLNGKVVLKVVGDSSRPWLNGAINAYKAGSNYAIGANGLMALCIDGGKYTNTPSVGISGIASASRARFKLVKGTADTVTNVSNLISVVVTDDASCDGITAPTLLNNATVYKTHPDMRESLVKTEMTTSEIESWAADRSQSAAVLEEVAKLENGTGNDYNTTYDGARTLKGETAANYSLDKIVSVKFVELLTGEYSINRTNTNYSIGSAGGGYMVDCGDYVLVAFGDTEWEKDLDSDGTPSKTIQNSKEYGGPWRANTLSFTTDFDYTDGILLDDFYSIETGTGVGDYEGRANEFLKSEHTSGSEMSKIPTGGVLVDDTLYFGYMSVRNWTDTSVDGSGIWDCNYGGLAISRDYGRTWETPSDLTWPAGVGDMVQVSWEEKTDSNGNVTTAAGSKMVYENGYAQPYPIVNGNWLYIFSVPGGRKGNVKLMRVPLTEIENKAAYEYCVGRDENGDAIFEKGYEAMMSDYAAVEGPAGGLAMMYNKYLGEWMMFFASPSHFRYNNGGIHLRVAKTLDGVWSDPVLVMAQTSAPASNGDGTYKGYGRVYEPRVCGVYQNGSKMMLISSSWDIYQSIVWEIELAKK